MHRSTIRAFLKCLGASDREIYVGDAWARCPCPLAPWTHQSGSDSNPSFAVQYADSKPTFNCYSCKTGLAEDLPRYLQEYGAKPPEYRIREAWDILTEDDSKLILDISDNPMEKVLDRPWSEQWLESFMEAWRVQEAMDYLVGERNLKDWVVKELDIRWDSDKRAVCFPVRNWSGVLCGLRGRYTVVTKSKYHDYSQAQTRNKLVWLGEDWVDETLPVVLVESVFDVAKVYPVYSNVMAPLSVGIGLDKARRIGDLLDFVTFFDADEGGEKARTLIGKYLHGATIQHILPPKEGQDPGDLKYKQIRKLLRGKVPDV